jgi:hypothetical protein
MGEYGNGDRVGHALTLDDRRGLRESRVEVVLDPVRGRFQQGLDLAIEDGDELSGPPDA